MVMMKVSSYISDESSTTSEDVSCVFAIPIILYVTSCRAYSKGCRMALGFLNLTAHAYTLYSN